MAWGGLGVWGCSAAEAPTSSWARNQCGPLGSMPDYDERETHGHRGHMSENENPLIATTLGPPTRKPWRLKS